MVFHHVSTRKREQQFLEASQILTHALYELRLGDPIAHRLEERLRSIYHGDRDIPRLQPKTVVCALFLVEANHNAVYINAQRLAKATGCSKEWLKKLKARLFGPYRELLEEMITQRPIP
ncbi:MAG: hypothetical protein ACFFGZ_01880 [Candidatus Thorarchaeota archaeon]